MWTLEVHNKDNIEHTEQKKMHPRIHSNMLSGYNKYKYIINKLEILIRHPQIR
jgi:hypothetical protein